jgi:hypothetical protein
MHSPTLVFQLKETISSGLLRAVVPDVQSDCLKERENPAKAGLNCTARARAGNDRIPPLGKRACDDD